MQPASNLNAHVFKETSLTQQETRRPLPPLPVGIAPSLPAPAQAIRLLPPVRPKNRPPFSLPTELRPSRPSLSPLQNSSFLQQMSLQNLKVESSSSESDIEGFSGTVFEVYNFALENISFGSQVIVDKLEEKVLGECRHPWKQKRYAFALQELKLGFENLVSQHLKNFEHLQETPLLKQIKAIVHSLSLEENYGRQQYYDILGALRKVLCSQEYALELQKKIKWRKL